VGNHQSEFLAGAARSVRRRADGDHAAPQGPVFYAFKDGAKTHRFNRILIDAGLIHGL